MKALAVLYHMAQADFLERTRSYGFLVTLGAAVYLGWATIAGYAGMDVGGYRGVYNSAWIGTMVAMTTTTMVSLVGFYVVKNAIDRDRQTRVGQVLATTPITRAQYLLGKLASNLAVLAAIVVVLAVAAVVMHILKGEKRIRLWVLLNPFLLVALPALALVASLAVLFETVRWLRGGFGNVAYFFLWGLLLIVPVETKHPWADWICLLPVQNSVMEAARANIAEYKGGFSISVGPRRELDPARRFVWNGVDWTAGRVAQRLGTLAAAVGLVLIAALWFDRFDPARGRPLEEAVARGKRRWAMRRCEEGAAEEESAEPLRATRRDAHLEPLGAAALSPRFAGVYAAEVRLLMKRRRWWWYAGAAGLLIASVATPLPGVREVVLPLVWLWPVLVWSSLGTHEARHGTDQLLFSAPHPLGWQLPATWAAGATLSLLLGAIIGMRLLFSGDARAAGAWLVGALFIPTLALASGVWSGSSKFFEALYTALWYVGPLQHTPGLDFMGTTRAALDAGTPLVFLFSTGVLAALAFAGRQRQLRRL